MSEKPELLLGRKLYCWPCSGFNRVRVFLKGEPPDLHKVIECRVCGSELASLMSWGEDEWIGSKFVEDLGYITTLTIGPEAVASGFQTEEDRAAELLVEEQEWGVRIRRKKSRNFKLKKVLKFSAVSAAALGALQLILTVIAIYWKIYIWPFTEMWNAFMWLEPETIVLTGTVASSIAIGVGAFLTFLMRRKRL
jgi:hypothetical protein